MHNLKNSKFVRFDGNDPCEILQLFEEAYGQKMCKDFWKWRFFDNPVDKMQIMLCYDKSKLVSHYAVSPFKCIIGSRRVNAALSMTTMTHPEYSGLGLFPKTAAELYSKLQQENYAFVMGFPNANSQGIFRKKLNWQQFSFVPMLRYNTSLSKHHKFTKSNVIITKLSLSEFANSCEEVTGSNATRIEYSNKFIRWRFSENSGNKYEFYCVQNHDDRSYFALKHDPQYGCDIVASTSFDKTVIAGLIEHICQENLISKQSLTFNMWKDFRTEEFLEATACGFAPSMPITYFSGVSLNNNVLTEQLKSLRLNMVMSDVY